MPTEPQQEKEEQKGQEQSFAERLRTEKERVASEQLEKERLSVTLREGRKEIEAIIHEGAAERPTQHAAPIAVQAPKKRDIDPLTKAVEDILSEDLGPMYEGMNDEQRAQFKAEGERTASAIRKLIDHVHVKARSILDLVKRWLRLIPSVNRFFLEQEAKIKSDQIMQLHERMHRR